MTKKILGVASGGGHWVQLRRLAPAFEGGRCHFATVHAQYADDVPQAEGFHVLRDATRWDRWGLVVLMFQLFWLVFRLRPDVIVSTGAAPGYLAIRLGRLFGARTIWIDSVANVEELSLSGRRIGPHADLWLTQWPHLAREAGPQYIGSVI